jgi:hypothetical protein
MSEATRLSPSERTAHWALLIAGPSVVGALWLLSLITGHSCPWRAAVDLSCPLCGGTRATFALGTGRWSEALAYNLVAPAAVGLALLHGGVWAYEALHSRRLIADRHWARAWCWMAAAFLGAWLVKLIALAWLDLPDPALAH